MLLSQYANATPWKSFVPDFVVIVTAAPPAMPCSASKLPVVILTVSMVSSGGTYKVAWGSHTKISAAPSTRVLLLFRLEPFTFVLSERCGTSVMEFVNTGGVAPGTRLKRL